MFGFVLPPHGRAGGKKHPEPAKIRPILFRHFPPRHPCVGAFFRRADTLQDTANRLARHNGGHLSSDPDAMTRALKIKLSADTLLTFDPVQADNRRRFTGVAHSGKPFSQYGTQFVADLGGIRCLSIWIW